MTSARSMQIDLDSTPFYHCIARCVRRGFLCGIDKYTGVDYSHRKIWVESRLKELAGIFSIKISAYAIMSNHYHVVLHVDDKGSEAWSEREVKSRWAAIFPKDAAKLAIYDQTPSLKEAKQEKIELWRERLTSISWFMRCMNETIARLSNQEDDCTGRFWEGRFKSQALLDEGALLSAMVYVDLNPVRSVITNTPETSEFTSIYDRIQFIAKQLKKPKRKAVAPATATSETIDTLKQPTSLMPFSSNKSLVEEGEAAIEYKLSDYLELVDLTGKAIREDKKGAIPAQLAPILARLNINSKTWVSMIKNFEKHFYHAVGQEIYLLNFSQRRKRTAKGLQAAKNFYQAA